MTPKQAERLQTKIKQIKAELAADKKRWGGYYDDSRGLRYLPPRLYLQLGDFSGGLRYMNWFAKNFPDDLGFPDFLFEWTIILFKTGKLKMAEKKAFETFCRNTYIFDKYWGRTIVPIDKYEYSNVDTPDIDYFQYSHKQADLADFCVWFEHFLKTEKFLRSSNRYIEIHKQLKIENNQEKRSALVDEAEALEEEF